MRKSNAFYNNQGELIFPKNTISRKETNAPLTAGEWLFWVIWSADNNTGQSCRLLEKLFKKTTHWRMRKRLLKKGYL